MLACPTCRATFVEGTALCPMDGAKLTPHAEPADPLLGKMLDGRLHVLRRIGEGGMGTVYAAEHIGLGKEVAVKVLGEKHVGQTEIAARLRAEARLASAVCNPHIVEIFDVGETGDHRTFIVMELLAGESLAERLGRLGAMGEPAALGLGRQIAQALQAAHEQGIVHRDIKPENIFLCARPVGDFVKVLDFGISKALRGSEAFAPRLTQTGMIMGTPLYMSPEQARGEEDLDHRIDIYSFGVLLYECVTGQVPFGANNYLGVVSKITTTTPVPPRTRRPDLSISIACEQLILRAMATNREERYASMTAVQLDIERTLAGVTTLTPPPVPHRPSAGRLLWAGLGLFLAIIITALAIVPRENQRAPAMANREVRPPASVQAPPPSPAPASVQAPLSQPVPQRREAPRSRRQRPESDSSMPDVLHDEQAPNPFRPAIRPK